jgi:hypothetical protein
MDIIAPIINVAFIDLLRGLTQYLILLVALHR